MKAVKGNKEYTISEMQKKAYQNAGYDILDESGEVVAHGSSKTVPYGDYEKLKAENEELKRRIAKAEEEDAAETGETQEERGEPAKKGKAAGKAGG